MLKYHFTLKDGQNDVIEFDSGRTPNWQAVDACAAWDEVPTKRVRFDFAWVYFAAKQAGKLEALGIPDDTTLEEAVEYIADTFDVVNIDDNSKDSAPLAATPGK